MMLINNRAVQMDDLLDKMAEDIQLDQTRYGRMISHYEAVKNWIDDDEIFFKPYKYDIYPHGSVRIFTANKPLKNDEFDLDIAVHIKNNDKKFTPDVIFNHLKRRLEEHSTYKVALEVKNRCLRLNYHKDFHMDILPGIQETPNDPDRIIVPDRKLKDWVSSNPRGYATWFMSKANLVKESLLEKSLRAENIPIDDFKNKKPLQRAVQLIKRYRDIYFKDDDTYKTSSIILTTISGEIYNGESSIFDSIDSIITGIQNKINASSGKIKVVNPVNAMEDFTDKWDSEKQYYEHFKKFCLFLYSEWQKLKLENGVVAESAIFKNLFGEDLFNKAQSNQTLLIEEMRKAGSLNINRSTGSILSSASVISSTIKPNTFYGS